MNSETHKESLPTTSLYSDRPHQPAVQVPPSSKEGSRAGTDFKNKVKESSHHHEAHVTIALNKHHYHISGQSNYQSSIFTPVREGQLYTSFSSGVLVLSCLYIGLLLGLTQFASFGDDLQAQVNQYYQFLLDVNIMVFVGFGFLMTFLRRYCLSAVALNMGASAIVYVEAILVIGAMQQVAFGGKASSIIVDMPLLINAAFCAASCMIAFGAVIGKTTPGQLVMLLVAQVPIYAANQHLAVETFKALDMGGTIVIHLFGAYYGLAASYMLSRNQGAHGVDHPKNVSGYLNDAIAMVGTLFLWIYWPSFNGALASISPSDTSLSITDAQASSQFLCIVNTLLSLLGSTIATFAASAITGKGRLNMMHVQNSAIAGGVAMGSACTLHMTPGGSLVVGTAAGFLSVCGYTYVTPYLDRLIGLGDTCGIHNLHGMPAILGGLVAGLAALGQGSDYLSYSSGSLQLGYQVAAMACTVAIAISGGLVMGYLLSLPYPSPGLVPTEMFDDGVWWHGVDVEEAAPGAADFHPNPSVYARGSNHADSRMGMMSIGRTMPPRLPTSRSGDLIIMNATRHGVERSDSFSMIREDENEGLKATSMSKSPQN